jgi:transposase InsO family protein
LATVIELFLRLTCNERGFLPTLNGMSEAFVKTLKRDYVRVNPLPDAETVLRLIGDWIEDYNDNHPHSGLKWRSPREFIKAKTETA